MPKPSFDKIFEDAGAGAHVHSEECLRTSNGLYFCAHVQPNERVPADVAEAILAKKAGSWVLTEPGEYGPVIKKIFPTELDAFRELNEHISLPYGLKVLFVEYGKEI